MVGCGLNVTVEIMSPAVEFLPAAISLQLSLVYTRNLEFIKEQMFGIPEVEEFIQPAYEEAFHIPG